MLIQWTTCINVDHINYAGLTGLKGNQVKMNNFINDVENYLTHDKRNSPKSIL